MQSKIRAGFTSLEQSAIPIQSFCVFSDQFLKPRPTRPPPAPRPAPWRPKSTHRNSDNSLRVPHQASHLTGMDDDDWEDLTAHAKSDCFLVGLLCFLGGAALSLLATLLVIWCYKNLPEGDMGYDLDLSDDDSQFERTSYGEVDIDGDSVYPAPELKEDEMTIKQRRDTTASAISLNEFKIGETSQEKF